jgi:beta-glucosidase
MEDRAAAQRCLEGQNAWFFDPIYFGRYPESMVTGVGSRLPTFTPDELSLVHGSHMNVYFQNQYTANYATVRTDQTKTECGHDCDLNLNTSKYSPDGKPIGHKTPANEWLYKYPVGFRKYQKWISDRYSTDDQKMSIIVSENGWGDDDMDKESNLVDLDRCNYYREYIGNMSLAVNEDHVNVLGYFAWSLMDNFEWA